MPKREPVIFRAAAHFLAALAIFCAGCAGRAGGAGGAPRDASFWGPPVLPEYKARLHVKTSALLRISAEPAGPQEREDLLEWNAGYRVRREPPGAPGAPPVYEIQMLELRVRADFIGFDIRYDSREPWQEPHWSQPWLKVFHWHAGARWRVETPADGPLRVLEGPSPPQRYYISALPPALLQFIEAMMGEPFLEYALQRGGPRPADGASARVAIYGYGDAPTSLTLMAEPPEDDAATGRRGQAAARLAFRGDFPPGPSSLQGPRGLLMDLREGGLTASITFNRRTGQWTRCESLTLAELESILHYPAIPVPQTLRQTLRQSILVEPYIPEPLNSN